MSNIFETIEIKTVPNEESSQMVGAEIILTNGEEIVAIDVPEENQICGNEFNTHNKKSEDFTEGYIVMLGDGTFKLLQAGDITNGVFPDESTSMGSTTESDKSLEIVHAQIPLEGCDKKLVSPSQLKVHQRKHNGLLPHECDFCQKNFSTGYALKAHKRTHTGEKPYICPEISCQKRFKTSGDLQKHIRTHTGERPFKCGVCSKAFTTSNIRKVHMRVHTGEKPYECTHKGCERRFSSATNYRNHLRIHTGEKPYVCSVQSCQKRFTEYSSLYKHYTVHSQKKRYECSMCSRQYRQLSTLNIHINTIHKEKVNIYERNEDLETTNGIRPTFFKPINAAIKNPKPNVISQHFVLHPKNGMLSSDPKEISFKGANGEDVTSQQFMELQVKRNFLKTEEKKSEEISFVSVNESDPVFISSPTSTGIKNAPKTPLEFEPLKAMTRGSEAILVLTVPNDNEDPIQDH